MAAAFSRLPDSDNTTPVDCNADPGSSFSEYVISACATRNRGRGRDRRRSRSRRYDVPAPARN